MNEQSLGENIRTIREKAQLTLTLVAEAAGITKSTMSKIEKGRISSPISTLMRIAEALNVTLADLFAEPGGTKPYCLTRSGEGKTILRDGNKFGYAYESLMSGGGGKAAQAFVLTIHPDDPQGSFSHEGEEFIYMLSGKLVFTIAGEAMELEAGDSLHFESHHRHTTKALGSEPARFVCVFIRHPRRDGVT